MLQQKEKSDEEKDSFYDDLDRIYYDYPWMDVKIIISDMNAKVGKEDVYKPVSGKYSLHAESNDNGTRLINFTSSQSMVIGSTMFDHKCIHKMTWKSPDGNTFN
jgi:hypothetical protein